MCPQDNLRHKAESATLFLSQLISAFSLVALPCSVAVVAAVAVVAVVTITTAFSTSFAPSFSTAVTTVASVPVVPSIPASISPVSTSTSTSVAHAISLLILWDKELVQLGEAVPGRHDGHWCIDSFTLTHLLWEISKKTQVVKVHLAWCFFGCVALAALGAWSCEIWSQKAWCSRWPHPLYPEYLPELPKVRQKWQVRT